MTSGFGKATDGRARLAAKRSKARTRKAEKALVQPEEAARRIEERFGPGKAPKALQRHITPYANFMLTKQGKEPTTREIVKAYAITRSSIRRGARKVSTLCKSYPEYKPLKQLVQREDARPEDVFAALLFSPLGQRYLDAAERGEFDADSARQIAARTKCFGFPATMLDDMREAVKVGSRAAEIRKALRGTPESWVRYVKDNIPGVSAAKAGFIAALLGRGDVPTFDAREIYLWSARKYLSKEEKKSIGCDTRTTPKGKLVFTGTRGGKPDRRCKNPPDPNVEDVLTYRQRIRSYPFALREEHEPFREHLVHHALWDAYPDSGKQSKTTHGSVIRAMQFAGTGRKRKRQA